MFGNTDFPANRGAAIPLSQSGVHGRTRRVRPLLWAALALLSVASGITAGAAVVRYDLETPGSWITDDSATGIASTISIAETGLVTGVSVSFEASVPADQTGWAGDLYAYLQHENGFAVLLNRPGRTATDPFGYSDGRSVRVTFSDDAANGDIHRYRMELNGSDATPLLGALTGEWAPDGRAVDPDSVTGDTPRTAMLSNFAGHGLSGNWTLFIADLSGGGHYQLDRWGLQFEVQPIPEPGTTAAAVFAGVFALAAARRWRSGGVNSGR